MNRRFLVLPRAVLDVADIFNYFLAIDPRLAMRFYDAYDATLPLIESMPKAGGLLLLEESPDLDFRYCRPKGFDKYLIFYRVTDDVVEVVRVLHASRDLVDALRDR